MRFIGKVILDDGREVDIEETYRIIQEEDIKFFLKVEIFVYEAKSLDVEDIIEIASVEL